MREKLLRSGGSITLLLQIRTAVQRATNSHSDPASSVAVASSILRCSFSSPCSRRRCASVDCSDEEVGVVVDDSVFVLDHAQILGVDGPALVLLIHMILSVAHGRGLAHQLDLLVEQSVVANPLLDGENAAGDRDRQANGAAATRSSGSERVHDREAATKTRSSSTVELCSTVSQWVLLHACGSLDGGEGRAGRAALPLRFGCSSYRPAMSSFATSLRSGPRTNCVSMSRGSLAVGRV